MQIYLETERLYLRRFTSDDVDNLVDLDADPAVMRYLTGGKPTPRGQVEQVILPRILGDYDRFPGFGCWAAVEKATGAFVGWFLLRPRDAGAHPGGAGSGEAGSGEASPGDVQNPRGPAAVQPEVPHHFPVHLSYQHIVIPGVVALQPLPPRLGRGVGELQRSVVHLRLGHDLRERVRVRRSGHSDLDLIHGYPSIMVPPGNRQGRTRTPALGVAAHAVSGRGRGTPSPPSVLFSLSVGSAGPRSNAGVP